MPGNIWKLIFSKPKKQTRVRRKRPGTVPCLPVYTTTAGANEVSLLSNTEPPATTSGANEVSLLSTTEPRTTTSGANEVSLLSNTEPRTQSLTIQTSNLATNDSAAPPEYEVYDLSPASVRRSFML